MDEGATVDASPLILLSRAGQIDLLRLAAWRIVVPDAVAREIAAPNSDPHVTRTITATRWIEIVDSPIVPDPIRSWDLGDGESAVLAWLHGRSRSVGIIDDLAARRCAATLGIPVRGTLGLVLIAKRRGTIPAARPVVERLVEVGMYLSRRVIEESLTLVGE